ncbi:MAG: amidase [Nitriliruptorales bacterium]|nr:amidase [Nitriliruptorales bacterium]
MSALHELSATEAIDGLRDRSFSSEELVTSLLERIHDREQVVRAWAHLDPEQALEDAKERDRQPPEGPLHGLPVGVKDIIDTADQPTTYGAAPYAGHRPEHDATVVSRLRQAGAVILGKTVTTEFACFHPGPTTNPHDPSRTPGGSSSGSAAAVADRMVPVALGTQTAGSVVRPASFCGVFGLKPTFGVIDLRGVKAVSPSLDTLGVLARDVRDLTCLARVLADRPDPFDMPPNDVSMGFVRTAQWPWIADSVRDRIDAAVTPLIESGELAETSLPDDFAGLAEAQEVVMAVEATDTLGAEHAQHGDELSDNLLRFLERGEQLRWAYDAAQELAATCRAQLVDVFALHDVLVTPSVLGEAPPQEEGTGDPLLCRMWTLLGTPAVAVPGLLGPSGLPLGLQVVAAPGRDGLAVQAAARLADRFADRGTHGAHR